jgi:ADP-heptose:LPS heptosyltransferase
MNKYLIFRTDRIGDFIFSRILVQSIKKKNKRNVIDFVCSKYNSDYIKYFKDVNNHYILDKYDFRLLLKNKNLINSENYDYLIILDGKRRSIFYSIFLKAKFKIAILKDFRPFLILKIFFNKYFINSEINSQFINFVTIGNYLDIKLSEPINYYENYKLIKTKIKYIKKKSTLLHLDEKWFKGFYHNDYKYMNLNYKNFDNLISVIFNKFKKNIILTSGKIEVNDFDLIIDKNFYLKENNIYFSNKYKDKLIFINKTNFRDLEKIVKSSSSIICCEGAISHVSHAFNIKTIALINKISLKTAIFWTKHMKNINLIYRDNLNSVCKQITNVKF